MKEFKVTGMKCDHCRMKVENAIKQVEGVTQASVDLKQSTAQVEGNFNHLAIDEAIEDAGFLVE